MEAIAGLIAMIVAGGIFMLLPVLALWALCALIGGAIAPHGRATAGLALGFFLGPVGWVVCLLLPPPARRPRTIEEEERERARVRAKIAAGE